MPEKILEKESQIAEVPGRVLEIAGIPTAVTEDHSQVFYFWQSSGLKGADLFHIDAHADMNSGVDVMLEDLDNINFICTAVHFGIVSGVYWLNPHSEKRKLQDLGSRLGGQRRKLAPYVVGERIWWEEEKCEISGGCGRVIMPWEIIISGNLILDIDLDAFCCPNPDNAVRSQYNTRNWRQKIAETAGLLSGLKKPSIITITRSQGLEGDIMDSYVPAGLVDYVEEETLKRLRAVYS